MRLGFAIAAHLEPEILVVDEVLAVGDTEFQNKAIGKMQDVSRNDGRTVLFVSHNMGTIIKLCHNSVLLNNGSINEYGPTNLIVGNYLNRNSKVDEDVYISKKQSDTISISRVQTMLNNEICQEFGYDSEIQILISISYLFNDPSSQVSLTLLDISGRYISTKVVHLKDFKPKNGLINLRITLPSNIIAPNKYSFRVAIFNPIGETYDIAENICPITIYDTGSDMIDYENYEYDCCILDFKVNDLN